jgi:dolichol-phosphate mannosyltransferase
VKKIFESELKDFEFEIIFINDGSSDNSAEQVEILSEKDSKVRLVEFTRNFGKEVAISAGLHESRGSAAIIADSDLQHPLELIPSFIDEWKKGYPLVVGVRETSKSDTFIKKMGSSVYYKLINLIADHKITPHATDFRLLDRQVINEFNKLKEKRRISRGLIDWFGFQTKFIPFEANERVSGKPSYSHFKLFKLAVYSVLTLSLFPLRFAISLGVFVMFLSGVLGVLQISDHYYLHQFAFSGTGMLANFIVFLVGVIITLLGIIAIYLGNVHEETQDRPLYVVRKRIG